MSESPVPERSFLVQKFARINFGQFHVVGYSVAGEETVVQIPELQKLLHYICENGFEHHVAANFSNTAAAVQEAAVRYLGWQMYRHQS